MIDLLVAIRFPARASAYPGIIDLREMLSLHKVQENTRLWLDAADRVTAFALVDHYHNLHFEFDRQATHPEIEAEIVDWGMLCVRRSAQELGGACTLDASCGSDDAGRISLLERHGFLPQELRSLGMVRSLDEPIPAPQVPAGFSIRHVSGAREAEALVALHRAAFGTDNMTVEERLAMMSVPDYDPLLDLLAISPDGRLAAYCTCSISREENALTGRNEGYTDPVATHPDFRRRGLARALLLTGLDRLKERGMETALLGTSSENVAMLRTAEAAGFRVQSTTIWYSKRAIQDEEERT